MGILSKLFGSSDLINSVGNTIDSLVTSDEERIQLKNEIEKAIMSHESKMQEHVAKYDEEITKRHANDMASDSWLSKNVRPCILIFLTVSTVVLAYLSIFFLENDKIILLTPWITLLQVLLVTAFTFYFGSRGLEKIQKIKKGLK